MMADIVSTRHVRTNTGNVKKVTQILCQKPGMANIEDKGGATPLMFASNKGHCQVSSPFHAKSAFFVTNCVYCRYVRFCWKPKLKLM